MQACNGRYPAIKPTEFSFLVLKIPSKKLYCFYPVTCVHHAFRDVQDFQGGQHLELGGLPYTTLNTRRTFHPIWYFSA